MTPPEQPDHSISGVPMAIQVLSGMGGLVLVVGIVLLGYSYLDSGSWGTLHDPPARVTILGILILIGAALSYAVQQSRE